MSLENEHIDPVGLLPKVFSGEATAEENRIIDEWLAANPTNQAALDDFARLWNITASASAPGEIDIDAEWKVMETAIAPAADRSIALLSILKIAAAVVLITSLTFLGIKITGIKSEKSPAAHLSIVTLPDGSLITLNAGSKIAYKKGFGITHRNLSLKGEAYFEVKENRGLPFIITAGEAGIRVTGTKFNVKAYNENPVIKVTVTSGSVVLFETVRPLKETVLGAGETGIYTRSAKTVTKLTHVDMNDLAWKTLIIDFQNTPLTEVADILMNTYHVPLEIDTVVKNCSVTVRFENQPVDSVINVLKSTLDLTITLKGKRTIISGKACH